nr:MAG TPA: Single strand binding protein [Caudoviricetes sp.]DAY44318.1 MAG TPA: Single strand binding protein [Caudoviricetes sp.]
MINNVVLTGRITRNLELKQTNNNNSSLNITLAVERNFKDQSGQKQTDFISCKAFGKRAETIAQYCQKGDLIGITGSIQTGSYQKQDGSTVYTTDVMVDGLSLFPKPKQDNQANQFNQHLNNFNQQNNLAQNNAYNGFNNQNGDNALNYINQPHNVQNNGYMRQNNQQQQMQMSGTGGINNTNNLFNDFGNDINLDNVFENVINPFKQE